MNLINLFSAFWAFLTSNFSKYTILIFFLIFMINFFLNIIFDENKYFLIRAKIFKFLNSLIKRRDFEKKYISSDIKGRLNSARKNIYCGNMILPKAIDVEWVEEQAPDAYEIKEGEFVVRLDPSTEQSQNIVHMARIIVQKTSLTGIRHLVEKPLQEAIDINLTKIILRKSRNDDAVSWFFTNIFKPIDEKNGKLKSWNIKINEIDEKGLFNTLLLIELEEFSRRISGIQPRDYMIGEITGFVNYLHKIATKKQGEDVNLDYLRAYLKTAIVLVAKTNTVLEKGIDPYIKAAKNHLTNKIHALYLIIWDKPHLKNLHKSDFYDYSKFCDKLSKSIEKLDGVHLYLEVKKYTYVNPNGERNSGRLIRYTTDENYLDCTIS